MLRLLLRYSIMKNAFVKLTVIVALFASKEISNAN